MTSKLLKEAIADAKAVRETALANAKIALEEAFTPKLQSMLSKKLAEELEGEEEEVNENDVSSEIGKGDNKQPAAKAFDSAAESDELGAAGVKKTSAETGKEDKNVEKVAGLKEENEKEKPQDITGATPGSGLNEEEEEELHEEEEELHEEDDLDLEEIIKELEGQVDEEEAPIEEEEDAPVAEPVAEEGEEVYEYGDDAPVKEEDELDLDEILREMGYGDDEEMAAEGEDAPVAAPAENDVLEIEDDNAEQLSQLKHEVEEKEHELEEAYNVIKSLKGTINEVNLLNAKLLYVNKLFRSYNLTNEQKTKVVETLDRTKNVREVKLVYSTIAESFKIGTGVSKKSVTKLTEGYASKAAKSTAPAKKIITENTFADRFKKLAGINKY
jgi:hypothetical protein